MHRLAIALLLLAGCLGAETRQCKNGATCPYDEACTEVPIASGAALCGAPRLVEACAKVEEFTPCDFTSTGSRDGSCLGSVCTQCTSIDVTGCRAPGWNRMTSGTTTSLQSVFVAKPGEAYAGGENRSLLRYDGKAWTLSTIEASGLPAGSTVRGIWSGTALYVAASGGEILQQQGEAWSIVHTAGSPLTALSGAGSTIVAAGLAGTVARFDGTWSTQQVSPPAPLNGVWVADADNAIAVGAQGTIFRFKQGAWTVDRPQQAGEPPLRAVWGRSPDDVWAVGDRLSPDGINILHYTGGTWTRVVPTALARDAFLNGVWGSGEHVVAVGPLGVVVRFDGTTWTRVAVTGEPQLNAVSGSTIDNVMAVGVSGVIVRYTGTN